MNRPRVVALVALIAALGLAGISFALRDRGGPRNVALSVTATATTTTGPIATTTVAAATTTAAVTTTTVPPPSTTVAPAPSTTAIALPPTAVTTGVTSAPPAPVGGAGTGAVSGRTIAIDPGHDGGNYAHTAEISRLIFIGTQTRACDTTGTATNDGYSEAAYTLDVGAAPSSGVAGGRRARRDDPHDQRRLGPVHRPARRYRQRRARRRRDLDPRRRRPGRWARLPRVDARAHRRATPTTSTRVAPPRGRRPRRVPRDGHADLDLLRPQGLAERTDFGGLNLSNVPKVFIETGNMRNATDAGLLDPAVPPGRGRGAAVGLNQFLAGR